MTQHLTTYYDGDNLYIRIVDKATLKMWVPGTGETPGSFSDTASDFANSIITLTRNQITGGFVFYRPDEFPNGEYDFLIYFDSPSDYTVAPEAPFRMVATDAQMFFIWPNQPFVSGVSNTISKWI